MKRTATYLRMPVFQSSGFYAIVYNNSVSAFKMKVITSLIRECFTEENIISHARELCQGVKSASKRP